jgi:hypothetical protein
MSSEGVSGRVFVMLRGGQSSALAGAAVVVALALCVGRSLHAQEEFQAPQVDESTLALYWLKGRFRAPVSCVREDGSTIELEEAIVVREGDKQSGMETLRITFFGIDVPDATKCFSLIEPDVPDRRGSVYVTYRSTRRKGVGVHDFKRAAKDRLLEYQIVAGTLRVRDIGQPDSDARIIRFEDDYPLRVSTVTPRSDGAKLLAAYGKEGSDPRRRLRFQMEGPMEFRFDGSFIEDESRWR